MTIFVSGDSNSVRKNGWVSILRDNPRTPAPVINISIGGAPSHMSLFRALQQDLKPGDVFVWAYGINDELYVDKAGYSIAELLWVIEKIIERCHGAGAVFAPAIFQMRYYSQKGRASEYRRALHEFFGRHGISYLDVNDRYLTDHPGRTIMPAEFYQDHLHYSQNPLILTSIAEGVLDLIGKTTVGAYSGAGLRPIRLLNRFPDADEGYVENSNLGRITVWNPTGRGTSIRLPGPGRVVGLFLTTTLLGGVWDVTFGGRTDSISVAFADRAFDRTMLKFVSLSVVTGKSFVHEDDMEMMINWNSHPQEICADQWFLDRPGPENIAGQSARLVAVLIEGITAA